MRTIEQTNDYTGDVRLDGSYFQGMLSAIDYSTTVDVPCITPAYDRLSLEERMNLLSDNPLAWHTPLRDRYETYTRCRLKELDLASYSPVGSFKFRGAWNAIASLPYEKLLQHGVITASAGNHGLGVALAVKRINDLYHGRGYDHIGRRRAAARIYVPETTAPTKLEQIKLYGGDDVELIVGGDTYSDAYDNATEYMKYSQQSTFVHPFDDEAVINGQSTVGQEVLRQLQQHVIEPSRTVIVLPVGGGGLLAGVVKAVSQAYPDPADRPKIIGAQLAGADSAAQTWQQYKTTGHLEPVTLSGDINGLADGTAVKRMGSLTAKYLPSVNDFVVVTNQEIAKGYSDVLDAISMNYNEVYTNNGIDPLYGLQESASMIAKVAADKFAREHDGMTVVNLKTGINYDPDKVNKFLALHDHVTLSTTAKSRDTNE